MVHQINTDFYKEENPCRVLYLHGLSFHMQYFLYLRRSLTRAWRTHVLLVLLLACAILLPLCFSILQASYNYGYMLRKEYVSGGHDIGILNAQSGDEAIFADMVGARAVWENGKLYIDRDPDNPKTDFETGTDPLQSYVHIAIINSGKRYIVDEYYENYFGSDPCDRIPRAVFALMVAFSCLIAIVSLLLFYQRQRAEQKKLRSIGAGNPQIAALYIVHFCIVNVVACFVSFGISTGFMYLLLRRFLEMFRIGVQRHVSTAHDWIVFHMDIPQMLQILGMYSLSCLVFVLLWYAIRLRIAPSPCDNKIRFPFWKRHSIRNTAMLLAHIFCRRGTFSLFFSILIAIPLVVSSVLLLQLREDPEEAVSAVSTKGGIRIGVDMRFFPDFTAEELAYFENLAGVARVEASYVRSTTYYSVTYVSDDSSETRELYVRFVKSGDVDAEPDVDENGEILYKAMYDPAASNIQYEIGTVLSLHTDARVHNARSAKVQIIGYVDPDKAYEKRLELNEGDEEIAKNGFRNEIYLYCRGSDLRDITENESCNSFRIYLTHVSYNTSVEEAIFDYFTPEQLGLYLNNYTDKEVAYNRAVGMNLLYTTLSALLFLFFAVITSLSLIDYAASHRETLRLLHMQGASHRAIIAAFVEILLPPAILTCAAVWAIVTPVEREYYRLRGYTDALMAKMDLRMIDDPRYLLAALAVAAVFVVPAVVTVARELRRLERG